MKYLFKPIISAILISGVVTLLVINVHKEKVEFVFGSDFLTKLINWDKSGMTACEQENIDNTTVTDFTPISGSQIINLRDKVVVSCGMDMKVSVPANVALTLFETIYVPYEYAIPYELAKQALGGNSNARCSDYVEPLLLACPQILKPYVKSKD